MLGHARSVAAEDSPAAGSFMCLAGTHIKPEVFFLICLAFYRLSQPVGGWEFQSNLMFALNSVKPVKVIVGNLWLIP